MKQTSVHSLDSRQEELLVSHGILKAQYVFSMVLGLYIQMQEWNISGVKELS